MKTFNIKKACSGISENYRNNIERRVQELRTLGPFSNISDKRIKNTIITSTLITNGLLVHVGTKFPIFGVLVSLPLVMASVNDLFGKTPVNKMKAESSDKAPCSPLSFCDGIKVEHKSY